MRWGNVLIVTLIMIGIAAYELPKLKKHARKDRAVFIILLLTGWLLLLFDLPYTKGPITLVEALFKPLSTIIEPE
ncbi:hypothetical protein [Paenibacillus sp. YYML68]|uniref:hypothetical protein n=1 Tax=Paenibacillus sp. YYML68 TaxID=2909250 RepID=UPI00248FAD12|nr:hypothetical protein [Paenibacillus sp. YYML68]